MATPTKSQKPTILGLGVPASTQWPRPKRFCPNWHASFGDNGYLHVRPLHKTNYFSHIAILISCQPRLKENIQNNLVSLATGLHVIQVKKTVKNKDIFLKIEIRK